MQVSKWLGHSTFTLTLDVYGDYIPEQDGGADNNLLIAACKPVLELPKDTVNRISVRSFDCPDCVGWQTLSGVSRHTPWPI